jgi:hypothetical protein
MRPRDLSPWRLILAFLDKRAAPMNRQQEFPFEHEVVIERITSLNEKQRGAIRAVLKTLLEAALSLSEDTRDDKRKD